jgi:hypothetical protein
MYLDPHGQGQVLFYPYYTVNAGQSSLITLVNTTARGKYLAVSFHEGQLGDTTLDFYVFLAPHDTWTGTLFELGTGGVANLLTADTSCTNPDLHADSLPKLADGRPYVPFSTAFAPQPPPPGQALRTREGYVQVIEAGELLAGNATSASERRCVELRTTLSTLRANALTPPGGGVYGSLAIVNAAAGTYIATQATAIGGFSDHVVLTSAAVTPATDLTMGVHEAQVGLGNRLTMVTYANSVDAVSALLMNDSLSGEFVTEPAAGATTEWVLSQPTKRYYTSALPVPPPYASASHPVPEMACLPYDAEIHDREQRLISVLMELDPPPVGTSSLCFATDVVRFGSSSNASMLGSRLAGFVGTLIPATTSGSMKLTLGAGESGGVTFLPATSGPKLAGLPTIGFQAVNYVNANVVQGVLANYAAAEPLRATVACADATGAAVACP